MFDSEVVNEAERAKRSGIISHKITVGKERVTYSNSGQDNFFSSILTVT